MFKVDRYEEDEDSDQLESKPIPISQIVKEKKSKAQKAKPPVEVEAPKAKRIRTSPPIEEAKVYHSNPVIEAPEQVAEKENSDIDEAKEEHSSEAEGSIPESPSEKEDITDVAEIENKVENVGFLPVFQPFNEEAENESRKKQFKKSKLGLPEWLANPTAVSSQETLPLTDLSLDGVLAPQLIKRCEKLNITELFAGKGIPP